MLISDLHSANQSPLLHLPLDCTFTISGVHATQARLFPPLFLSDSYFLFHRKTNVLRSRRCFHQYDTWLQFAEEVKGEPLSRSVVLNHLDAAAL